MKIEEIHSIIEKSIVCNENLHSIILDETLEKLNNAENMDSIPIEVIKAIKGLGSEKVMLLVEYGDDKTEFMIVNKKVNLVMMISITKTKNGNYDFCIHSNVKK